MIVTTDQLADIFGVAPTTITRWIKAGMPTARAGGSGRGNVNEIDVAAAIEWRINEEATRRAGETPRDRLDRLRGDELERKMMIENGVLVFLPDLESDYSARILTLKNALYELMIDFTEKLSISKPESDALIAALGVIFERAAADADIGEDYTDDEDITSCTLDD